MSFAYVRPTEEDLDEERIADWLAIEAFDEPAEFPDWDELA